MTIASTRHPIRILFLLVGLNRGGKERLVLDLCNHIDGETTDQSYLLSMGGGGFAGDVASARYPHFECRRFLPVDLRVVAKIRSIVLKYRIDVVHAHEAVEGLHAFLAVRRLKTKVVLSYHGYESSIKARRVLRFLIPRVSLNLAVSKAFLADLEKKLGYDCRDFRILHNGIDPSRLAGGLPTLRQELQIGGNEFLFGTVANFLRGKDPLTICRALGRLSDRSSQLVKFVFVGQRYDEFAQNYDKCVEYLAEKGISDRVFFLGGRADIANVLRSLDAVVFSSVQETFGIAVVEALLARTPVFVSDIGAFREVTNGGKYALTYPPSDDGALAMLMEGFVDTNGRKAYNIEEASSWALDNFSIRAIYLRLRGYYSQLLQGT